MNHYYLVLSKEFAQRYNNTREGSNVFRYLTTKDGRFVCSANALNEFPSLFSEARRELVSLETSDFDVSSTPIDANNNSQTLEFRRERKALAIAKQVEDYVDSAYPPFSRDILMLLLSQAICRSNSTVIRRVELLLEWMIAIQLYKQDKIEELQSCVVEEDIRTFFIDLGQFGESDPKIKLEEFSDRTKPGILAWVRSLFGIT